MGTALALSGRVKRELIGEPIVDRDRSDEPVISYLFGRTHVPQRKQVLILWDGLSILMAVLNCKIHSRLSLVLDRIVSTAFAGRYESSCFSSQLGRFLYV